MLAEGWGGKERFLLWIWTTLTAAIVIVFVIAWVRWEQKRNPKKAKPMKVVRWTAGKQEVSEWSIVVVLALAVLVVWLLLEYAE